MSKVVDYAVKGKAFLAKYPALSAALVSFGVFVAGYFGLNISGDTLVAVVGVLDAVFGMAVHAKVVPLAKVEPVVPVVVKSAADPNPPIAAPDKPAEPVIPAGPQPEPPLPATPAPATPPVVETAPQPAPPVDPPATPPNISQTP